MHGVSAPSTEPGKQRPWMQMQYIRSPVHTLCIGHASSMAAILLAAGEPGHRGESKRPVVESPWSPFTSECQRFWHPPQL
eukprot:COSAG01_NODE_36471_length_517_cov_1.114833_2_plen_79_part_01